jgi:hypothetical protein
MHQQGAVLQFLGSLSEALSQALQLCQQYMSDEKLMAITGEDGQQIARSREEIQGQFKVELSFDPRDLDLEYLKTLVDVLVKILSLDTVSSVQRDKVVGRLLGAFNPVLAEDAWRPADAARADEIADEQSNFAKIAAGVEPPMMAEGQDFGMRLQALEQIEAANPEAVGKLSPISRRIYDARKKHLANQVQQLKNAQIGRTVGAPALG